MKRNNLLLMIFALLVLAMSLYSFSQTHFVVDQTRLNVFIEIGNVSGIDLDNESLSYGTMVPETSAKKSIKISNDYSNELLVNLSSKGNASRFINHDNSIIVGPSKSKEVGIVAKVPKNAQRGNYSGTFTATMKKKPF